MRKVSLTLSVMMVFVVVLLAACAGNQTSSPASATNKSGEAAKTDAKNPIVLGSTMAMTGGAGFLGSSMKEVFDMVAKQVNAEGGINGRELKLIYYDDENNPEKAVQNAQKLIKKDGAKIILGPSTAQTSGAIQSVADKNKVIMFSLSPTYTAPGNSFGFVTSLKQDAFHEIPHEWYKQKGIKKVGLIATTDTSGNISAKIIEAMNKKDGIEYVIERMGLQDIDVTPQLTRLKSAGIEALEIVGPGAPPAIAIKNAGQIGLDIPLILNASQVSYAFANSIKDYIPEQLYFAGTAPIAWKGLSEQNPLKPLMVKFADDFKKEYNKEIDHVTAIGYDSILTVIEAIKKAGSDDPEAVKHALETQFNNFIVTTAVVNYTPEDHQGTTNDGAVMLKLDPDLSWHVEWEPKFWEKK